jgi:hypothetical protein
MGKNNGPKPAELKDMPQVVANVQIVVMRNGNITVSGYPKEIQQALAILHNAELAIINQFLKLAAEGKVKFAEESRIYKPRGFVDPKLIKKVN